MATNQYQTPVSTAYKPYQPRRGSGPPVLPPLPVPQYSRGNVRPYDSPISPDFDYESPFRSNLDRKPSDESEYFGAGRAGRLSEAHLYSEEIPLRENPQPFPQPNDSQRQLPYAEEGVIGAPDGERPKKRRPRERREPREPEKKGFFGGKVPWVVYTLSLIQITVFIAELVKNGMRQLYYTVTLVCANL